MIVYFKCLCKTQEKLRALELQKLYNAEIRVTRNSPQWQKEAKKYNMKMPFIVENEELKTARPLYG